VTLAVYPPSVIRRFMEMWGLGHTEPFGPSGFTWDNGRDTRIIVTQAPHDEVEILHASVSHPTKNPSYAELAHLHLSVFGRQRWSYQVFAPRTEHVSIHDHALHLWGRADGQPMLPDFTQGTGSI